MKIVASGDWHLGLKIADYDCSDDIVRAVEQVVDETNRGADLFVVLGDVFHKSNPDPASICAAIDLLKEVGCPTIVIQGNHEAPKKFEKGAVEIFSRAKMLHDVRVSVHPEVISFDGVPIGLAPYLTDYGAQQIAFDTAQESIDAIFDEFLKANVKAVFSHLDVEGAQVGPNVFMRGARLALPLNKSRKLPCPVVNGHEHVRQKIGRNLWLPGSVAATSFGQIERNTGFIVLEV